LWDTAGQERFRNLIPNYIRDSSVAVIVYDVTKKESFKGLQKWIDDVKYQRGEGAIIAILANKIDIENREILYEEGRKLAEENNFLFQEVSANTGVNVQEFFKQIAALLPDVPDQTSQTSHSRAEHQSQPI
jgi:Ras-related protein Rab-6A